MSGRLDGKRCLITAAAAGIGRETVIAFAREGAEVIATDIDEAALAALAEAYPTVTAERLDVTSVTEIDAVMQRSGTLDALVNCAGYVASGAILECSEADWQRSFTLNVNSMFYMCRAALPHMLSAGRGSIINIASVASSMKGVPNRFVYGTTKAAVIGLTKAIAADYVAKGIRANAICPGTIMTPSLEQRVRELGEDYDASMAQFVSRQPMGRLGRASEVAAVCVYLASNESEFTTGQAIAIDGGWTI